MTRVAIFAIKTEPKWKAIALAIPYLLVISGPFLLAPLPDGYVYEPHIRTLLPLFAIVPAALLLEPLHRTWAIVTREQVIIAHCSESPGGLDTVAQWSE